MELTFSTCAPLLASLSYAPVPLTDDGRLIGPVFATQVKWPASYDGAPVGVLTAAPMPRNEYAPISNAQDTYLATVAVSVRDELKADVDAIVKRCTGEAKCPVRLAAGQALHVFKLSGGPFSTVRTAGHCEPDTVIVESAASYIQLQGQWKDEISLLDIARNELPMMDREHAQALVDEVNRLLSDRAPVVDYFPPMRAPRPLIPEGESLRWRHERARERLQENGFRNLLPLRSADLSVEQDGYADSNGRWLYNSHVDLSGHHVGLSLRGFALVECTTRQRDDIDELVKSFGPALVRTTDGKQVWLFRSPQDGPDQALSGVAGRVTVTRTGIVALSTGKWAPDLLTVKTTDLPDFDAHHGQRLERMLQSLPPTDYSKRRKSA